MKIMEFKMRFETWLSLLAPIFCYNIKIWERKGQNCDEIIWSKGIRRKFWGWGNLQKEYERNFQQKESPFPIVEKELRCFLRPKEGIFPVQDIFG